MLKDMNMVGVLLQCTVFATLLYLTNYYSVLKMIKSVPVGPLSETLKIAPGESGPYVQCTSLEMKRT